MWADISLRVDLQCVRPYFYVTVGHLYVFLRKLPILTGLFVFLLLNYFCMLDVNSLSDIWFTDICSHLKVTLSSHFTFGDREVEFPMPPSLVKPFLKCYHYISTSYWIQFFSICISTHLFPFSFNKGPEKQREKNVLFEFVYKETIWKSKCKLI